MAFDIFGPKSALHIDNEDQRLFNIGNLLSINTPLLNSLGNRFYDSTIINPGAVIRYRNELLQLKSAYIEQLGPKIAKKKKLILKKNEIYHQILNQILLKDEVFSQIDSFLKICDEALKENCGIECHGD